MTSAEIIFALLEVNLAGGAAILLVLALRRPARRLLGARCAYGLWVIPLFAALAALAPLPPAPVPAVLNVAPKIIVETSVGTPGASAAGWAPLLLGLWATGSALSFGLVAWRQRRFVSSLGGLTPTASRREFVASARGIGPAVIGAVRPRIVLPADFADRFDAAERETILAHERIHLSAGDPAINGMIALTTCLNWFNPLVHLAARAARVDQELACDAAVLKKTGASRKTYAAALLKAQFVPASLPLGCTWPSRSPHPLKERLVMLKKTPPSPFRNLAGVTLITLMASTASYAAWGMQPQEQTSARQTQISEPVWEQLPTGDDIVPFYEHLEPGESARAVLECIAAADGGLTDCEVTSATPANRGIEQAAVALSLKFKMRPTSANGEPVAGTSIRLPIEVPALEGLSGGSVAAGNSLSALELVRTAPRLGRGEEAQAVIDCTVTEQARLRDCVQVSEAPVGRGIGAAAVRIATRMDYSRMDQDWRSKIGETVRVPLTVSGPE